MFSRGLERDRSIKWVNSKIQPLRAKYLFKVNNNDVINSFLLIEHVLPNWIILSQITTEYPMFSFDVPCKHQKTRGFLLFSGRSKGNTGLKRVNTQIEIISEPSFQNEYQRR